LDKIRSLKRAGSVRETTGSVANAGKGKAGNDRKLKVKPSEVQKEQRRLEREIEKLEAELETVNELRTEHATDYEKLMELDEQEAVLKAQLEELLEDWEEVANLEV
jgi:predicted nuclease with TOPRIM domain